MTNLLEIRGLTRRFGGLTAVNAVDLDVAEGELVSIIGPNGAGPTRARSVSRARTSRSSRPTSSRAWASRARSSMAACSPT
jgi:ABC-type branched-subunit amino acid transport system ATPase component